MASVESFETSIESKFVELRLFIAQLFTHTRMKNMQ